VAGPSRAVLLTGRTTMQLRDAGTVPAGEAALEKILTDRGYAVQTADGTPGAEAIPSPGKPLFLTVSYKFQAPYAGVAQKYRDLYSQARLDTFDREPAAKNARRDKEMLTGILANQRLAAAADATLAEHVAAFVAAGGTYVYGSYPDIDGLFREQAAELDRKRREAILNRIQQLVHERTIYAPIWQLGFLNGVGPRVEESSLGAIPGFAYSGPYEDVKLKN